MAAAGAVSAIRRLVEVASNDKEMVARLLLICFPVIMHSFTVDGLDACEDGLDITAICLYHSDRVYPEMWKLYPQMLYIGAGNNDDVDGGIAFEFLGAIVTCIQNYIAKDLQTFMTKAPDQELSYLEMTFKFVQQVLVINSKKKSKIEGCSVLKVVVTLFECLPGQMDPAMENFVGVLCAELHLLTQ